MNSRKINLAEYIAENKLIGYTNLEESKKNSFLDLDDDIIDFFESGISIYDIEFEYTDDTHEYNYMYVILIYEKKVYTIKFQIKKESESEEDEH